MASDRAVDLEDLYREVILDHYRRPRHRGRLAEPTIAQRGSNPLCGDEVEIGVRLEGDRLAEIGVEGQGCSISRASASIMAQLLDGRTVDEVDEIVAAFKRMMTGDGQVDEDRIGDAEALIGVRKFPVRVKCATLAWNTLKEALELYTKRSP